MKKKDLRNVLVNSSRLWIILVTYHKHRTFPTALWPCNPVPNTSDFRVNGSVGTERNAMGRKLSISIQRS